MGIALHSQGISIECIHGATEEGDAVAFEVLKKYGLAPRIEHLAHDGPDPRVRVHLGPDPNQLPFLLQSVNKPPQISIRHFPFLSAEFSLAHILSSALP